MVIEAVCVPLSSVADTVAVPHEVAVNVLDAIKLASGAVVGETVPFVPAKAIVRPFKTVGLIAAPLEFLLTSAVSVEEPPTGIVEGAAVNCRSMRGSASKVPLPV